MKVIRIYTSTVALWDQILGNEMKIRSIMSREVNGQFGDGELAVAVAEIVYFLLILACLR